MNKQPVEMRVRDCAAALLPVGHLRWAIAEGDMPEENQGPRSGNDQPRDCVHSEQRQGNGSRPHHVFFSDREPLGPCLINVPGQRTKHLWFNDLRDPVPIPRGTDYSSLIESDVPIVVRHTRSTPGKPQMHCSAPSRLLLMNQLFRIQRKEFPVHDRFLDSLIHPARIYCAQGIAT